MYCKHNVNEDNRFKISVEGFETCTDYASNSGTANYATYNANNVALTRMVYSTVPSQTTAYHTVQSLATFTDSNNALISGSKGQYIFGISAFSDERLKTNIKDSKINALDTINQIKLREFDFKNDKYGQHRDIGYVAQELKEVVPECVIAVPQDEKITGYNELYQIEDKHLIPYIIKAIQEISDKLN